MNEEKRKYHRDYYHNKVDKTHRRQTVAARKKEIREWLDGLKVGKKCGNCTEGHPACLDYHHVGTKEFQIADAVRCGWSKKRILAEIAKCILICANCHRKLHHERV